MASSWGIIDVTLPWVLLAGDFPWGSAARIPFKQAVSESVKIIYN
jgi:hypothetical protein